MLYEFCLKKRNWSSVGQGSCDWQQGALDGGEAKPRKPLMTPSVAACDSQSVEKAPFVTVNQCGQCPQRGCGKGLAAGRVRLFPFSLLPSLSVSSTSWYFLC